MLQCFFSYWFLSVSKTSFSCTFRGGLPTYLPAKSLQACRVPLSLQHQAPLSMGFSRPEFWSGLKCLPPRDLPNSEIKLSSLTSPALAGGFFTTSAMRGRRQWHPTPVLLPGKSHGRRSLVGYSPRGREESDTTKRFHFHFSILCSGEENGNPVQYSCLEKPRDRGAWWAAVYGVAQSRTWLTWLSSSSAMRSICDKFS